MIRKHDQIDHVFQNSSELSKLFSRCERFSRHETAILIMRERIIILFPDRLLAVAQTRLSLMAIGAKIVQLGDNLAPVAGRRRAMAARALTGYGGLDIVVNNAGNLRDAIIQ